MSDMSSISISDWLIVILISLTTTVQKFISPKVYILRRNTHDLYNTSTIGDINTLGGISYL